MLMVGDRYDKDGLAVKGCNMDYIILSALPRTRAK
jgi:hypothetical protein